MSNVVVSLSGGMDSSTLLLRAIKEYNGNVTALSFDYGQKHRVELERAQSLVDYLGENGHAIYPDCRQEFRDADDAAFRAGNWDAEMVDYFTPYLEGDKFDILKDGEVLCEELGIEFDEVYSRTNTSYKPIQIDGVWYSDYKSASSVERVEAFLKLGRKDPALYADENGPVEWWQVVYQVCKVLFGYER
jgi:7-cyano-7-deazaguanine synthase in queuosine biosynthesis